MTNNEILHALMKEGIKLHHEKKHAEACDVYARAVHFAETSWSPDAPEVLQPVVFLAMAVGEVDAGGHERIAEVLELERRALEIARSRFGEESPWISFVLEKIGHTFQWLGKLEEARSRLEMAVEIFAKFYGDVPSTAHHLIRLGGLLLKMERPADALPHCERALRIEEAHEQNSSRVMFAATWAGLCLRGVGRMEEAAVQFERSLAILHMIRPPEANRESAYSKELREWIAETRAKP